ncbi:GntR family transcriptional regulator [Roseinatronobacter sp.]
MIQPDTACSTDSHTLHDRLVDGIRDIILQGDLAESVRIPEAQLCARFQVSRTPLREALKALATEGLVTLRPNRGAIVTPLDATLLSDVFEAKQALEHFIGMHAAKRANVADLIALEDLHGTLMQVADLGDYSTYTLLNAQFHDRLAVAAGNKQIQKIYAKLQAQIRRARLVINQNPARIHESASEHEGIMDALRIRAPLDLADRLVQHNKATAEAFLLEVQAGKTCPNKV